MSYSTRENTEVESLDSIMMKEVANSSVENGNVENNDKNDVQHYSLDTIQGVEDERYSYDYDPEADIPLSKVESIKEIRDEIPDKFSGWGLASVIACAIFNLNTWGANSAYALYFEVYLDNDIFPGANKYDYAILGGLAFSSGLSLSPFFNYVIGKIGVKVTIFIGLIINFVAILLASYATKLWQIYCTQGVMSGFGMGVVCVANVNIVPQWFKGGPGGKRNLAMGLSACGSGIGGIVYNIGLEPLLQKRSYNWSLRVQAIMGLGLNLIALLMIKTRNANIKPVFKVYDPLIWTNFGCLCLLVWIMFTLFGYVVLMYNLGDFTVSLGYTQKQASVVSTMVPVGIVWGRPLCGKIGDIIGPINITIIASWLVALLSLAMWIPCRNYATAIALAMMCGSLMGTIWLTLASINATITGLKKVGISMSVCWVATGLFGFASPIMGIALKKNGPEFDPTMYQNASIFVGLCYIMAGVVLVFTRGWLISRNRKVNPETDDEDDVLRIKVSTKEMLSNMFNIEKV